MNDGNRMIPKKKLKEFVFKHYPKKIGDSAIKTINKKIEEFLLLVIGKAARKADICGGKIIKKEEQVMGLS